MIVLNAIVKVLDGKGNEAEQAFQKLVPKVLKDPGTITYAVHRSIDNPSKFFVYEKYENEEAIKYHGSTPHFQEYRQTMAPLREKPSEVERYRQIA